MEEGREGGAPRAVVRLLLLRPSKWGGVGGREELGGWHTKLATPNPVRERPNDWKNAFNLTLTSNQVRLSKQGHTIAKKIPKNGRVPNLGAKLT